MTIRIALIGFGKIARDEHLPAIMADRRFQLAAVATPGKDPQVGVPCFKSSQIMFEAMADELDAVAICTPPNVRHAIARCALEAGLDVLLEKPPTVTLGELQDLERLARSSGQTLYVGWHSQHAPGVAVAAEAMAGKAVGKLKIVWHEDVRKWHPGQDWIWLPGGFGVLDPGINALSIVTRILDMSLLVDAANLCFPSNKQAPIAAMIRFAGSSMTAEMDWRPTETEQWTIEIESSCGIALELRDGGKRLFVDSVEQAVSVLSSYPSIYKRFAELSASRSIEVDQEPLRIVADIFLRGKIDHVESFD